MSNYAEGVDQKYIDRFKGGQNFGKEDRDRYDAFVKQIEGKNLNKEVAAEAYKGGTFGDEDKKRYDALMKARGYQDQNPTPEPTPDPTPDPTPGNNESNPTPVPTPQSDYDIEQGQGSETGIKSDTGLGGKDFVDYFKDAGQSKDTKNFLADYRSSAQERIKNLDVMDTSAINTDLNRSIQDSYDRSTMENFFTFGDMRNKDYKSPKWENSKITPVEIPDLEKISKRYKVD